MVTTLALACGGSETAPADTGEPTPRATTEIPAPTLVPAPSVTFNNRVTLYGAEAGDGAMGLATGDFNGDGLLDVALTASFADGPDNARPDAGETYLFFGPFTGGEARDAGLGEQDVTVFGAAAGDGSGRAVAAADFNGDGLDDLALGAPFAAGPDEDRGAAGATHVLFGAPSWPAAIDLAAAPPDSTVFGADDNDLAGFALAVADANGDGVHDLLIGAFWADGPDESRTDAGEAYLIFGSPSWPATIDVAGGAQDVTIFGADADDRLGETLAAGDVNGDGIDDLAVVATFGSGPDDGRPKAGEVHVILGGSLEAAYDLRLRGGAVTVLGHDEGDQIGHSAALGDFDGDGDADLLLGAVSADGPGNDRSLAGEAYLVPGGADAPATVDTLAAEDALRVYGSDPVDRLGRSVAAGDVNGDGRSDLILAASGGDGLDEAALDAGELHIIYGRPVLSGALDLARQPSDIAVQGPDPGDSIGSNNTGRPSLLSTDVDGDGLDDILVSGLADGPENGRPDAGEAQILFARR